jgi:hypothetical protein
MTMGNGEKIFLGLLGVILIAVLFYEFAGGAPAMAATPADTDELPNVAGPYGGSLTSGPAYLLYNAPYAFAPPVNNFLPAVTSGMTATPAASSINATSPACACED